MFRGRFMHTIDAKGRVTGVVDNATPMSETILPSPGIVLGVLELAGGTAKSLHLGVGALVKHPAFGTAPVMH